MRALGVVRKIDELGRVVIPVEVRRRFGIDVKDSVEIYIDDNDSIILKSMSRRVFSAAMQKTFLTIMVKIFALNVQKEWLYMLKVRIDISDRIVYYNIYSRICKARCL